MVNNRPRATMGANYEERTDIAYKLWKLTRRLARPQLEEIQPVPGVDVSH